MKDKFQFSSANFKAISRVPPTPSKNPGENTGRIHFYLYICVILSFQLQRHVGGASPTSAVHVEPAADPAKARSLDLSVRRPVLYRMS